MKSPTKASQDSGIDIKLVRAVIRQLGDRSYLEDVYNHGADAGFPGFTSYFDTESFWKRNRKEITALAKGEAEEMGQSPDMLIASFQCLKLDSANPEDWDDIQDVVLCLTGHDPQGTNVPNALAWFALEEVAHAMCEED